MKVTLFPNDNLVVKARRLSPHMASPIINNFHDLQKNILNHNAITVMTHYRISLDIFGIDNDRDTNLYNHFFNIKITILTYYWMTILTRVHFIIILFIF